MILSKEQIAASSTEELLALLDHYEEQATIFDGKQNAIKINLNSCYGTMGSPFFAWYRMEMAEAITLFSQANTRTVFDVINNFMTKYTGVNKDYVIYSDTDSVVFSAGSVAANVSGDKTEKCKAVADFASGDILTAINTKLDEVSKALNCRENGLSLKLESICDKGIWFAKKRYVIDVIYDENGMRASKKRKVTGVEVVSAATPKLARKRLSSVIDLMFDGTQEDLYKTIDAVNKEYMTAVPEDISVNKSCSDMNKWVSPNGSFVSGAPVQSKASIAYNRILKEKKLDEYDKINAGDKMKYLYLKKPNPSGFEVMGFATKLPKEFGLHDYIDRKTMFEKSYLAPVERLISAIGWNIVKKNTVDSDLFGF